MLGLVHDWADLPRLAGVGAGPEVAEAVRVAVDALLVARAAARAERNLAEADRIRDVLTLAGVQVTDVGGQAQWQPGPEFDPSKLEGAI